ncbi:phage tail protein [Metasolibacillus fluoroglycofenilyticus]|uniref:phage tail protein n=1 Tax=Metasolibacillus fluoroglycofenilyticus TaxID=1239396 RepID=UPI000D348A11|nr:phage tail protein [Metasolibacillus fluoroglycofenilyticus]
MTQYGTIITNIGLAQIANAQVTQQKVGLEHIALGDGNGSYYIPTANQSALVNEVWRGPVSNVTIDPANDNRIIIEGLIPTTAGGFTIREIAVFDDQNQLIAVGQYPEKYKPQLSEGVAEETLIQFVIETNNADAVELSIDPTIIIASREYVDEKVASVSAGLVQLEEDFTTHLDKDDNPHNTTKAQVGLANVTNDAQLKKSGDTATGRMVFNAGFRTLNENNIIMSAGSVANKDGLIFTNSLDFLSNSANAYGFKFATTGMGTPNGNLHIGMVKGNSPDVLDLLLKITYQGEILVKDTHRVWHDGNVPVKVGTGSPEGVVTATQGTIYLNRSGGTGTTLYVKENFTGNTGWTAK